MNNNKLLYLISALLLITFSCNDDNSNSSNDCNGHISFAVGSFDYVGNCNVYEGDYEPGKFRVQGFHYQNANPNSTSYAITILEEFQAPELVIMFNPEEPYNVGIELYTEFPYVDGEPGISQMSWKNKDQSNPVSGGFVSNLSVLDGSWASMTINEVDGQYISGTFESVLIYEDILSGVVNTYELIDGVFENVFMEKI